MQCPPVGETVKLQTTKSGTERLSNSSKQLSAYTKNVNYMLIIMPPIIKNFGHSKGNELICEYLKS